MPTPNIYIIIIIIIILNQTLITSFHCMENSHVCTITKKYCCY